MNLTSSDFHFSKKPVGWRQLWPQERSFTSPCIGGSFNVFFHCYKCVGCADSFIKQDWHSPVYSGLLEYIGVRWSTQLQYISVHMCMVMQFFSKFIWAHFEINLEAERTDPSQKCPVQFSMGLLQLVYALAYMLTQVIYRERKKLSFDIGRTKTHLLEFSRLPSARFSYIEAFKHVGHWAGL